jgi:hypothetical protein
MITLLQKIVDKDISTHELVAAISLYYYTESPTVAQMATRWNVPQSDIHQIYYKLSRATNKEQAIILFKSIIYLVEAGIYTNLSQVQTKLNEL